MKDTTITATDTWTNPYPLDKGDSVSVSIKGATWTGTVKVRRWLREWGDDPDTIPNYIGVIQEYTDNIESVDISGGMYYYQIGTDEAWTGTAYVHLQ